MVRDPSRSGSALSAAASALPALPPTSATMEAIGHSPCSASSRAERSFAARWSSCIIAIVSSRVEPCAMTKFALSVPCSGEAKKRHCTCPLMNIVADQASSTISPARTT